jgi:predicted GIY-YIG superfamily endonuclease
VAKEKTKSDQLYVLQCKDNKDSKIKVKIGVTSNIERRIKALQTGNPNKIELLFVEYRTNPTKAERYLHKCFAKKRQEGEWFEDLTLNEIRSRLMLFFDQDE